MIRGLLVLVVLMMLVGALLQAAPRIPLISWMGRLPGDFHLDTRNGRYHFPIMTCLILNLLLSILIKSLRFLVR